MNRIVHWIGVLGLALGGASSAHALCPEFGLPSGSEIVELETNQGSICIELLRNEAPGTVLNFLNYVLRGDYDGSVIHRSVPGFVIQGGGFLAESDRLAPLPTDPPILNEPCTPPNGQSICTERGNLRGTIAMARIGGQVNSATSQFFINLVDNRNPLDSADQGFTVFGNVLGTTMNIADSIAGLSRILPDDAWWLAPASAGALTQLPASSFPALDANAFGCWDPLDWTAVVSPLNDLQPLPDPVFGTAIYPLSGGCGTQIPRGTFVEDPGTVACTDSDLLSTAITGPQTLGTKLDPGTSDLLQYEFSCEQAAEALIQRDLWRDDYGSRLVPELVTIEQASYQTVPEPGLGVAIGFGVASLLGLRRNRMFRSS
jgi:cyclophilin family peptidyl-prolyl cis-trans isomerase